MRARVAVLLDAAFFLLLSFVETPRLQGGELDLLFNTSAPKSRSAPTRLGKAFATWDEIARCGRGVWWFVVMRCLDVGTSIPVLVIRATTLDLTY